MSHAFRVAAIRREAEVYLSQGLHQEALSIYADFIADNKDIQPALRSAIEAFMLRVYKDALDAHRDENECLSQVEINLIKKGWGGAASDIDQLTSAEVFMNLGFYEHALEEYRLLLKKYAHDFTAFNRQTAKDESNAC